MTRRIAALAAAALVAVGGATLATSASADNFSFSVGAPGVAFGYSNYGYAPYYYAPAPAYYYGPPVVYYHHPYYHHHYYRPYAYYRNW